MSSSLFPSLTSCNVMKHDIRFWWLLLLQSGEIVFSFHSSIHLSIQRRHEQKKSLRECLSLSPSPFVSSLFNVSHQFLPFSISLLPWSTCLLSPFLSSPLIPLYVSLPDAHSSPHSSPSSNICRVSIREKNEWKNERKEENCLMLLMLRLFANE